MPLLFNVKRANAYSNVNFAAILAFGKVNSVAKFAFPKANF